MKFHYVRKEIKLSLLEKIMLLFGVKIEVYIGTRCEKQTIEILYRNKVIEL